MASNADTVHEVEILLKDLPTKSVTLAPGKATVVREINDVQIKVYIISPLLIAYLSWKTITNKFPARS